MINLIAYLKNRILPKRKVDVLEQAEEIINGKKTRGFKYPIIDEGVDETYRQSRPGMHSSV